VDLGCRTKKSTGYSQESMDTISSSNTPSSLIFDLSTSSKTVGVGQSVAMPNCCIVFKFMILIVEGVWYKDSSNSD
jgi:hypothetical protein